MTAALAPLLVDREAVQIIREQAAQRAAERRAQLLTTPNLTPGTRADYGREIKACASILRACDAALATVDRAA